MLRVGIVGTSWWTESMYLPALADHPTARVVGVCGRRLEPGQALASQWGLDHVWTDYEEMIKSGLVDAVLVAGTNGIHHPVSIASLNAGLHLLCEKPIGLNLAEADEMVQAARAAGTVTMVPFTYRYMPVFAEVKKLIDEGFVGNPHHLNLRYFTGYARTPEYAWRFDTELAGSGVLGDLGSHWLHLAEWLMGPICQISAVTERFVERDPRPDGSAYQQAEDSAILVTRFSSGAMGTLQVCAMSHEGTKFDQTHHLDLHGSSGTVYGYCDWDQTQQVRKVAVGEPGPAQLHQISDQSWQGVRRSPVHDTYRDLFRTRDVMTRQWASAASQGRSVTPDMESGARVQLLLDAALRSAKSNSTMIDVPGRYLDWLTR